MFAASESGLGIVTAAGLLCLVFTFRRVWRDLDDMRDADSARRVVVASFVRTVAAVVWPLLLLSAVCSTDKGNRVLLLPLLVNTTFWLLDVCFMYHAPSNQTDRPASLRLEPSSLTGLTFGLCGLAGARPDSKYSYLFLYAIVGCLVVVMPSHNLRPGCLSEQLFESVQKAVLMWCIGFLIAAVALTRYHHCASDVPVSSAL